LSEKTRKTFGRYRRKKQEGTEVFPGEVDSEGGKRYNCTKGGGSSHNGGKSGRDKEKIGLRQISEIGWGRAVRLSGQEKSSREKHWL